MDLNYGPEYDAFRQEVRTFLRSHAETAPRAAIGLGEHGRQLQQWQRTLVDAGYACRTVPCEYGGFGAEPDLLKTIILDEEFRSANVSAGMVNQGISMFVPTLLQFGSEEQKRRYIAPTIHGEMIWCQGYSEPGSGSDLASLRTSAVLDGDTFVINGQKIWTSTAKEAQMMFALVRTDADAPKHKGISYLLVDMDSEGLDVRPLTMMTGHAGFNEVFFEDVRVPAANLVGEPGQGWAIGKATLVHERNMLGAAEGSANTMARCLKVLRDIGADADPALCDQAMRLAARTEAMRYHSLRMLTDRLKGRSSGVGGLITKLNGCQLNHDICKLGIDALGSAGLMTEADSAARDGGVWQFEYMFQLGMIIGGGTAQIQKNIISEIGLGMPREPKAVGINKA